jgi:hypothetical protein
MYQYMLRLCKIQRHSREMIAVERCSFMRAHETEPHGLCSSVAAFALYSSDSYNGECIQQILLVLSGGRQKTCHPPLLQGRGERAGLVHWYWMGCVEGEETSPTQLSSCYGL